MRKKNLVKLLVTGIIMTFLLAAAIPAMGAPEKVRVFVEFVPGAKGKVEQSLAIAGAKFHYTFDELNSFVVTLPGQALDGITKNPNVVSIEEDVPRYRVEPVAMDAAVESALWDDLAYDGAEILPWGVQAVQAPQVWDAAQPSIGTGVKVCIVDTGYYADHEDLPAASGGIAQLDDPYTEDGYGHGTHVAGTIAALDNQIGVIGVSPGVELYIIKFFGNDGLATRASDLVAAAYQCREFGADIISMSLSGPTPSGKERRAFDDVYSSGILSIGAASNDGIEEYHYPASYESVISVAALDANEAYADFSQFNDAVELAAPGVGVLSTIPYTDSSTLTVEGVVYSGFHIEFSARGDVSGPLADGGLCTSPGDWTGAVVLCSRGENSFAEKINNVASGGGLAAMIYNNIPSEDLYATMGEDTGTPVIGIGFTMETGEDLLTKTGKTADVSSIFSWPADGYEAWGGTSMATPHVSAVAALLWAAYPDATNVEIRAAMDATAKDLGDPGRDVHYGFGLVQAFDALEYLGSGSSGPLVVTVSTDKPVYYDRETVIINVVVEPGVDGIAGAEVTAVVTTAGGDILTFSGLTGENGDVSFSFKAMTKRYGTGQYQVEVTASYPGREDGMDAATFVVNNK